MKTRRKLHICSLTRWQLLSMRTHMHGCLLHWRTRRWQTSWPNIYKILPREALAPVGFLNRVNSALNLLMRTGVKLDHHSSASTVISAHICLPAPSPDNLSTSTPMKGVAMEKCGDGSLMRCVCTRETDSPLCAVLLRNEEAWLSWMYMSTQRLPLSLLFYLFQVHAWIGTPFSMPTFFNIHHLCFCAPLAVYLVSLHVPWKIETIKEEEP